MGNGCIRCRDDEVTTVKKVRVIDHPCGKKEHVTEIHHKQKKSRGYIEDMNIEEIG